MKDPLAPEDAYDFFKLLQDAKPSEIEKAYEQILNINPEKAYEAVSLWDNLRYPEQRLFIDIFRYQKESEQIANKDFSFSLPAIPDKEFLNKLKHDFIIRQNQKIKFSEKTILSIDKDFRL